MQTHLLSSIAKAYYYATLALLISKYHIERAYKNKSNTISRRLLSYKIENSREGSKQTIWTVQGLKFLKISFPNLVEVQDKTTMQDSGGAKFATGGSRVGPEGTRLSSDSSRTSLPPVSEHRRMNLSDVIIWKRLTRTLQQRVADRRSERRTFCWLGRSTSSRSANDIPETQFEPTYKMEPECKLEQSKCRSTMRGYLSETLQNVAYDAEKCRDLSTKMSDEIKLRIKQANLLPPRYKCIVYIVLGEKKDQGVSVSSESAWDKKTDNFVAVTFQNNSLFCAATLFAVYME